MKKMTLITMVAFFAAATSFGALIERSWSGQLLTITTTASSGDAIITTDGSAFGSTVELSTDGGTSFSALGSSPSFGWNSGMFFVNNFNFSADEGDNVVLRAYADTSLGANTAYIDSYAGPLADLDDGTPPGATDLNVTFGNTDAQWTVVPEPATIGLMGIAGVGLFAARRKVS